MMGAPMPMGGPMGGPPMGGPPMQIDMYGNPMPMGGGPMPMQDPYGMAHGAPVGMAQQTTTTKTTTTRQMAPGPSIPDPNMIAMHKHTLRESTEGVNVHCIACQRDIHTDHSCEPTGQQFLWCIIMGLYGIPCLCVPFCIPACYKQTH